VPVERHGQVIGVKQDQLDEYIKAHSQVWPGVLNKIKECNISNYSIFQRGDFLFSYYEYIGIDYASDMAKMAAHDETKKWWDFVGPMQEPLKDRKEGEWWAEMRSVFHMD